MDVQGDKKLVVVVTGSQGYVGKEVVKQLLELERPIEIRALDIVEAEKEVANVRNIVCDITDPEQCKAACSGHVDVVLHTAAKINWTPFSDADAVWKVNYDGTKNMMEAAKAAGCKSFVHCSSIDVAFNGTDAPDIKESDPYIEHMDAYTSSKSDAEKLVAGFNDNTMRTCALRLTYVYGPGEKLKIGNIIYMVKTGNLPARLGNSKNKQSWIYHANCAHFVLQAGLRLFEGTKEHKELLAGQVVNLKDETPDSNFWEFLQPFVIAAGLSFPSRFPYIPFWFAYTLAVILETLSTLLHWVGITYTPLITRFSTAAVCVNVVVNGEKMKQVMPGITARYSWEECFSSSAKWVMNNRNEITCDPGR